MKLIDKAVDLMEYTYRETNKKDRFPIKYRTIISELQSNTLHIYKLLMIANKLQTIEYGSARKKNQLEVVALCDDISGLVELIHRLNIISVNKMEAWQNYITDVRNMTLAWIRSDSKR